MKKEIQNAAILIDVRTPEEYAEGYLEGALNIPHDQLLARLDEVKASPEDLVVVYCKSGGRSEFAKEVLESQGFSNVINAGGYQDLK